MDDKAPLLPRNKPDRSSPRNNRCQSLCLILFAFITFSMVAVFCGVPLYCTLGSCGRNDEGETATKVPLEAHIMSKCPDARDCLQKLILPTMEQVSDKVDFRLSYIGRTTEKDDGVQCPHGQTECLGNILELCAASEYPDPKIYLGFTMCLSRQYDEIPKRELVQDCALEHGLDFDKLNHCMSKDDGAYGMGMLRESVTRSAELNITTSCTIRLDGKERCVVEDGKFQDCKGGSKPEDLIRDINKLYKEANR